MLDPDISKCFAYHHVQRVWKTTKVERKRWLTMGQLASPLHFSNADDAKAIADACASRMSSYQGLAAKRIKEYEVEFTSEQ